MVSFRQDVLFVRLLLDSYKHFSPFARICALMLLARNVTLIEFLAPRRATCEGLLLLKRLPLLATPETLLGRRTPGAPHPLS